jgi:hypothetical protein
LSAGRHIFDFSLDIPALVKWAGGKQYGLEEFDMPATFVEKGARGSILYELEVRVKRSGTLSIDDLCVAGQAVYFQALMVYQVNPAVLVLPRNSPGATLGQT